MTDQRQQYSARWLAERWLALLLGLVIVADLRAQPAQLPAPETITARQGLPQAFVPAITQDKRGFIWMATRDGLARYDGYTFKVFQPKNTPRPSLSSPGLTRLSISPDDYLWIQNDQFGLDGFDPLQETFVNLSREPAYQRAFAKDTLVDVYPDSHQRLWLIFRQSGLSCYDLKSRRFIHYSTRSKVPGTQSAFAVAEDGWNQLWLATDRGLSRFDSTTRQFIPVGYPTRNDQARTPLTDPIRRLYRRPNGELWLCTNQTLTRWNPKTGHTVVYPLAGPNKRADWPQQITADSQGNEYLRLDQQLFRYTETQGLQALTPPGGAAMYVSLFIDRSDVLWLGTDLIGVHKINLRATPFHNTANRRSFIDDWLLNYVGLSTSQLPAWPKETTSYNLRTTIDKNGQVWFAAGGTPLYQLNPVTRQLTAKAGPIPLRDYLLERPTLLATDPDGQVWLAHPDWIGHYDAIRNQWVQFSTAIAPIIRSPMLKLVVDRQALWIATASAGLYRVSRQSGQIQQYQRDAHNPASISSNNLYWLSDDPLDANRLWIGTFGSGLCQFDKRTGRSIHITTRQGLPNNVVYAAIPDRWGSVWIATNQGMGQLDRHTGHIRIYRQEDGLINDEFNRFHAVSMPNGQIVLGGISGLVGFMPRTIRPDTFQPVVQLSDVLVNNRVWPLDSLLKPGGNGQLETLSLPYNQNFVTVRFAAMQYNRLGQAMYRYRLGGLSPDWVTTSRPEAIFTALPPGQYDLRIQAANTSGQWSRHVRQLRIDIGFPWWQTGWAYAGYSSLVIGLILTFSRFRNRQLRQRQDQLNQQREADQLRRLDELKTRFFANVTHELRTPLTLILGPTQQLKARLHGPENQQWLALIDRQAQQLLALTNQLLDLSRLEAGVVQVHAQPGDLVTFVAQLIESVRPEADRKGLTLGLTNELTRSRYRFDAEKLERITLNLLTNAIKFTRQGSVQVTLRGAVELVVDDTGPGLTDSEQARVFDRYYQAKPSSASAPGSGIGLALVKELVTLQRGTVRVTSPWTDAHSGTRFVVSLPYQPVAELADSPQTGSASLSDTSSQPPAVPGNLPPDMTPLILVVEDQADLRAFIGQTVADLGRIQLAEDGQVGWETALALGPDLIISDVLMPRMDGLALCRALKEDLRTSHIPVLLLTAKTTFNDRIQGLSGGADAYLTKPFHPAELQLQVGNLLARQQRQRAWLQGQFLRPDETPATSLVTDESTFTVPTPTSDPSFMDQLQAVLAQHISDPRFGVEELASALQLSRVQLYRKVKALTGFTVTELLRTYRLGQARQQLRTTASVADVAEAVGFESTSYFSRCFREQYGLTPTAYQRGEEPTPTA
ncbi:helix-turn-helix domain-containing protein [uncultured Spirosoma sp.]|uniref:helix-turn-helix domain-containing protein n=1 Tax=uncultured Spirosoma sp. TaxID=278208 RepID=UPI002590B09E|nr:helix-turn-helix domain-containing protein [uncultured Spirosoma sp.]